MIMMTWVRNESSFNIFSSASILILPFKFRVGRFSRLRIYAQDDDAEKESHSPDKSLIQASMHSSCWSSQQKYVYFFCSRVLAIKSLSTLINQRKKTTVLTVKSTSTFLFVEFGYLCTTMIAITKQPPAIIFYFCFKMFIFLSMQARLATK